MITEDAVALAAAVQGAAAEVGDWCPSGSPARRPTAAASFWRNATTMASSAGVSTVFFGIFGVFGVFGAPIGASAVVVRLRHSSDLGRSDR